MDEAEYVDEGKDNDEDGTEDEDDEDEDAVEPQAENVLQREA